jgi:hypothetical protein
MGVVHAPCVVWRRQEVGVPKAKRSAVDARFNTKMVQSVPNFGWKLRVWHTIRKPRVRELGRSGRLRIKCGCCEESLVIDYDRDALEINGVIASRDEWRAILEPILDGKHPKPRA